jgi:hypothetical protein
MIRGMDKAEIDAKLRSLKFKRETLRDLERSGEVVIEERSNFGPLPVIRLAKPARVDRIVKLSKR